jgi:hypothetical protein
MNRKERAERRDALLREIDALDSADHEEKKSDSMDMAIDKVATMAQKHGLFRSLGAGNQWVTLTVIATRKPRMMGAPMDDSGPIPKTEADEWEDCEPFALTFRASDPCEIMERGDNTEIIRHSGRNVWILVEESHDEVLDALGIETQENFEDDSAPENGVDFIGHPID